MEKLDVRGHNCVDEWHWVQELWNCPSCLPDSVWEFQVSTLPIFRAQKVNVWRLSRQKIDFQFAHVIHYEKTIHGYCLRLAQPRTRQKKLTLEFVINQTDEDWLWIIGKISGFRICTFWRLNRVRVRLFYIQGHLRTKTKMFS